MADTTVPAVAPINGTAQPAGAPQSPAAPDATQAKDDGKEGHRLFSAGYNEAKSKFEPKLTEAQKAVEELRAKVQQYETGNLNADELRKLNKELSDKAEAEAKRAQAMHDRFITALDSRVKALPQEFQDIVATADRNNLDAYATMLEKVEGLAKTKPGAAPQGGAISLADMSAPLEEYDQALRVGDSRKVFELQQKYGKNLNEALKRRHVTR